MTVVLLGNYGPDRQESMRRFALAMAEGYRREGVEVIEAAPARLFLRPALEGTRWAKWLGYADKYLLFPWRLRALMAALKRKGRRAVLHVADHSNALYLPLLFLLPFPSLVTCHDVLAIRAARGDFPLRPTGRFGRFLQRAILAGLRRAGHIVCVSQATADSLRALDPEAFAGDRLSVVEGGWIHSCAPASDAEVAAVRERYGLPSRYLLHVGGNSWYKNRPGAVAAYAALVRRRPDAPALVLAGKRPDAALAAEIARHGALLEGRLRFVEEFPDAVLSALYTGAEALLFPSFEEGFGVPLSEALACGCPVVTSDRPPMSGVTGGHALLAPAADPEALARQIERLLDAPPAARRERAAQGQAYFRAAFDPAAAARRYVEACRHLLDGEESVAAAFLYR